MSTPRDVVTRLALMAAAGLAVGCGPEPASEAAPASGLAAAADITTTLTVDTVHWRGEPDNRCRMAHPADSAESPTPKAVEALRRGAGFRCALREGGPEVRLVVGGEDGIPMSVDVHSAPDARRRSQQLLLDTSEHGSIHRGLVLGEDLNDDGWTDLKVQTWSGSGGLFYDVFMYDPARHAFARDTMLSGGGGVVPDEGRACVWTGRRSGVGHQFSAEWCWRGGAWVLVRADELDEVPSRPDCGGVPWERKARVLRDGRMQPVPVDTICRYYQ